MTSVFTLMTIRRLYNMACDGNRYNTGNEICSSDLRDLKDDVIIIDGYVNSEEDTVKDRFGIDRLTLTGIQNKADSAIDGFEQLIDDKIIAQGGVEIAEEWGEGESKSLSQKFLSSNFNYDEKGKLIFKNKGSDWKLSEFGGNLVTGEIDSLLVNSEGSEGVFLVRSQSGGGAVILSMNGEESIYIRIISGNVISPSLPSNSENRSWEFQRVTTVSKIIKAFAYYVPDTNIALKNVNIDSVIGDLEHYDTDTYRQLRYIGMTSGDSISAKLSPRINGKMRVLYLATPGSSTASFDINGYSVSIDGKSKTGHNMVAYADIDVPVNVELNVVIQSDSFNLIGLDPVTNISNDNFIVNNANEWAYYLDKDAYISSKGASDYAVQSDKNGLWAGSYHGGETAISPALWLHDGGIQAFDEMPSFTTTRKFSIIQNTLISWGTGEGLKTTSTTNFTRNSINIFGNFYDCNVGARTAYVGMGATDPSFTIAIGEGVVRATQDKSYELGMSNSILQINPKNGRSVLNLFSKPPVIATSGWGTRLSYVEKNYAKIYPAFIYRQSASTTGSTKLPVAFSFSFTKKFK